MTDTRHLCRVHVRREPLTDDTKFLCMEQAVGRPSDHRRELRLECIGNLMQEAAAAKEIRSLLLEHLLVVFATLGSRPGLQGTRLVEPLWPPSGHAHLHIVQLATARIVD